MAANWVYKIRKSISVPPRHLWQKIAKELDKETMFQQENKNCFIKQLLKKAKENMKH